MPALHVFSIYVLAALVLLYGAIVATIAVAVAGYRPRTSGRTPTVSIVVAAHNERHALGACLACLANQRYPADNCEIIVADDRSGDGTTAVIERFATVLPRFRAVRIDTVPEGVSPKKYALERAIAAARGDIILQTDADCLPPPGWVKEMTSHFEGTVGVVLGISPYTTDATLRGGFIAHEYLWNALLMSGSVALGYVTHATGRNLAFKRSLFNELGGYGESRSVLSGDDTLFVQRVRKHSTVSIACVTSPAAHVPTRPPSTWKAFLRQRLRHMSTGRYFSLTHLVVGGGVYALHGFMACAPFICLVTGRGWLVWLTAFLAKALVDACAAGVARRRLGLWFSVKRFLVNEYLLSLYMAVLPVAGSLAVPRWKENS